MQTFQFRSKGSEDNALILQSVCKKLFIRAFTKFFCLTLGLFGNIFIIFIFKIILLLLFRIFLFATVINCKWNRKKFYWNKEVSNMLLK